MSSEKSGDLSNPTTLRPHLYADIVKCCANQLYEEKENTTAISGNHSFLFNANYVGQKLTDFGINNKSTTRARAREGCALESSGCSLRSSLTSRTPARPKHNRVFGPDALILAPRLFDGSPRTSPRDNGTKDQREEEITTEKTRCKSRGR